MANPPRRTPVLALLAAAALVVVGAVEVPAAAAASHPAQAVDPPPDDTTTPSTDPPPDDTTTPSTDPPTTGPSTTPTTRRPTTTTRPRVTSPSAPAGSGWFALLPTLPALTGDEPTGTVRVGSAVADWLRGIAREAARRERFLRAVADATASTTTGPPAPTTTAARPPSTRRASTTTVLEGQALGQPISSRPTPDGGAEVLLGRGIMSATAIVAIGAMIVSARRRRRTA